MTDGRFALPPEGADYLRLSPETSIYLARNVFIFFGAALSLGSPAALSITAIHILLVDLFISREERLLEKQFGDALVHE